MKAFLLAAGLGCRLMPITKTRPKCLVEIAGHPMLDWWAKLFIESGINEVLINTHYLSEQVHKYIELFNSSNKKMKYIESYEQILLGSGGTIKRNKEFVSSEEDFFICYADNLCNINLRDLMGFHKKNGSILTMALFHTNMPKECGIVSIKEDDGMITEFIEKPENPSGDLANAGVYVVNKEIFNIFPDIEKFDFGKDVLPLLIGRMYGLEVNAYLKDIGTIRNYEIAKQEWTYDYYKDTLTS